MTNDFQILSTNKFIGFADCNILSWCPTLNLLTISMNKMSIWVYRLNGERVYSINNKSPILSISFINNGKSFCLSGLDNLIKVYDSNNGKLIKVIEKGLNQIKLINWNYHKLDGDGNDELFNVDILKNLPKLSVNSNEITTVNLNEIDELNNDLLNYLIIVDSNSVSINFNNLLTVTDIQFPNLKVEFLHHFKNNDLFNQFFLIKNDETLELIELNFNEMINLTDRKYLIKIISQGCKVVAILNYMGEQMKYLQSEIKPFFQLFDRYLSNLGDMLSNHDENHAIHNENNYSKTKILNCFYDLLLTNLIPENLKDYWLNQLGERGLKRLNKLGNAIYDLLRKNLFTQLIASLERLVIILNDLKSLSKWFKDSENRFNFGLNHNSINNLLSYSKKLLKLFYKLIWDINEEQKLFNKFLNWVKLEVIDKLSKEDEMGSYINQAKQNSFKSSDLLNYINNYLFDSKIFNYFKLDLSQNQILIQGNCKDDIIEHFNNLDMDIKSNLINNTKLFTQSIIQFNKSIPLNIGDSAITKINSLDKNFGVVSVLNENGISLIKFSYLNPNDFIIRVVKVPSNFEIVNYEFKDEKELILLIKHDVFKLESINFINLFDVAPVIYYESINKIKSSLVDTLSSPKYLSINDSLGCLLDSNKQNYIIFNL